MSRQTCLPAFALVTMLRQCCLDAINEVFRSMSLSQSVLSCFIRNAGIFRWRPAICVVHHARQVPSRCRIARFSAGQSHWRAGPNQRESPRASDASPGSAAALATQCGSSAAAAQAAVRVSTSPDGSPDGSVHPVASPTPRPSPDAPAPPPACAPPSVPGSSPRSNAARHTSEGQVAGEEGQVARSPQNTDDRSAPASGEIDAAHASVWPAGVGMDGIRRAHVSAADCAPSLKLPIPDGPAPAVPGVRGTAHAAAVDAAIHEGRDAPRGDVIRDGAPRCADATAGGGGGAAAAAGAAVTCVSPAVMAGVGAAAAATEQAPAVAGLGAGGNGDPSVDAPDDGPSGPPDMQERQVSADDARHAAQTTAGLRPAAASALPAEAASDGNRSDGGRPGTAPAAPAGSAQGALCDAPGAATLEGSVPMDDAKRSQAAGVPASGVDRSAAAHQSSPAALARTPPAASAPQPAEGEQAAAAAGEDLGLDSDVQAELEEVLESMEPSWKAPAQGQSQQQRRPDEANGSSGCLEGACPPSRMLPCCGGCHAACCCRLRIHGMYDGMRGHAVAAVRTCRLVDCSFVLYGICSTDAPFLSWGNGLCGERVWSQRCPILGVIWGGAPVLLGVIWGRTIVLVAPCRCCPGARPVQPT